MKWTENEKEKLINLLKEKMSYNEIAVKMGRTYGSVRLKLQKLGYKSSDEQKIIKKCVYCDKEFNTTLSNDKKFCDNSCSASYNNKLRKIVNNCCNCNVEIPSWRTYCSNKCQGQYERKLIFEEIENGNMSFHQDSYKRYMINEYGEKCMECGWCEINPTTGKIPIQLEHINGNSEDNSLSNLKLLCPNCHSLTPTFGALNKGNGREKRRIKRQNKI
jgi:hypothetical protein